MVLLFGFANTTISISQAQSNNQTQFLSPIKIATKGAHGADLFVDPKTNEIYVTYIQTQNKSTNLYFTKSINNTKNFTNPIRINDRVGDVMWDGRVPPQIKVTKNGTIYTLYVSSKDAPGFMYGVRTLKMAKSLDGGKTFTPAVSVINKNDPELAKAFQTFDISNDGKIYVGSLNYDIKSLKNGTILDTSKANGSQASIIASVDGGQTFEPSKTIEKFTCECCNVNVLTTSGNDVYASWRQKFPIPPSTDPNTDNVIRDIVVAHSQDGGHTFPLIHKVANDNFSYNGCVHVGAPMAMDSKGNLHIVWYTGAKDHPGIYYAVSDDKGKTFTKPVPILTGKWVPPLRSDLTIDNKNNTWITWEDSYGLTANNVHWKFENTSAKIYVEKINGNNNTVTKFQPVNYDENGRAPTIATGNDLVTVLWNGNDDIDLSLLKTKA